MASPWALERFNGLAGLIPQVIGSALEKAFTRRAPAVPSIDTAPARQHQALRHALIMSGSSNQALLDTRWGEPTIADELSRSQR